jgi:hypothetical protein
MFFNVVIYIFAILQYLQSNVEPYSFSIFFCNVAIEMFYALLGQGRGGRTSCVRELRTGGAMEEQAVLGNWRRGSGGEWRTLS